jgi:uncharacterized DUF497 family protein
VRVRALVWKTVLVEKIIDKHGVWPDEVEEVIYEDAGKEVRRISGERYAVFGSSGDGRLLFIVLDRASEHGEFVVVTARDMTEREKRAYRRRARR